MSLRIGLYDFFAYTIPGALYFMILGFWLDAYNIISIDESIVYKLTLPAFLIFIGVGYICGLLVDAIAYRWLRLFRGRNRKAAEKAFQEFCKNYSSLNVNIRPGDWGMLLRAIKSKSLDAAADIEQHNVTAIMLRNISLGFILCSICLLVYFFIGNYSVWNIILCLIFILFSRIALIRSAVRRHWFYVAVFEGFAAHFYLEKIVAKTGQVTRSINGVVKEKQ
jgi:hypothetical protein